jgi:peptidoglycan/LPS O-acetylase OafA/YrhL
MQDPPKLAGGHRDDLQGLRAIAILLVVLCHAGVTRLRGGFVGVDVFFVLSGFLITGLLLKQAADGRVSLTDFYSRRARRILPAATLTLVVTDIVAYHLLNFVRARQVMWDSIWASFFAANVHFAQQGTDYFARAQPPSPLQNFWTLAVEEQFYIVWPTVLAAVVAGVALTRRARARRAHRRPMTGRALRRLLIVAGIITVASLAWSVYTAGSTVSYFSTLARAWELGLGAVLAIATVGRTVPARLRTVLGWLGLAAIAAAAVIFSSSTPFPGSAALLPTLGAAAVIAAGLGGTPRLGIGRVLSLAPFRYVGDRSYALYLWHWPILIIALDYEGHELSTGVKLLLVASAFALSIVTYGLYENPIRRMDWSGSACAFAFSASTAAVVMVAAFTLSSIDSTTVARQAAPGRSPWQRDDVTALARESAKLDADSAQLDLTSAGGALWPVVAAVRAARHGAAIPSPLYPDVSTLLDAEYNLPGGCGAGDGESRSSICRLGASSTRRSIAVVGDSHAQMWMPAILAMAEKDRWTVVPLIKSGCTPARWLGDRSSGECRDWYAWATRQATALHPTVTIVTGAYAGETGREADAAVTDVGAIASRLRRATRHVVVVGDPPPQERQPVDCVLARHATMRTCTTSWGLDQQATGRAVSDAATRNGAGFIDSIGWFCFQYECPLVIGHTIAFLDPAHITRAYAQELAGPFGQAFRRAVSGRDGGAAP